MYRRKMIMTAAAAFAIGAAFAAQPTSVRADRPNSGVVQQRSPWVPGTNMLMSAHEPSAAPLAPPR
jgi:hypothetical protein